MANPLLDKLDGLDGPALKDRFAEARKAAVAAGATVEADAATRALQQSMRNAVRAMVKGIDARAAPLAAAPVPAPRPPAPMRPVAPPRPSAPAPAAAPTPKPTAPRPRWTPPPPPVPPPIDPNDDNIPF